ncbi:DUF4156 domain-containing protein [Vibrio methylphosphonaticus]|uniref:DUF4156 domain-containing protein n=1 Tax=Vibrio methylphosphonaticus TaxID=2946866 RepID=UPI002029D05B|nr:DUF4156 domain-containing protein [Vibrio methylphosphonaticus]MCL9776074.1 DUF4156 domain-containing protein [Vibrio methylphosphonaticus]
MYSFCTHKISAALLCIVMLSGCSSPAHNLTQQSASVVLRLDQNIDTSQCQWKGDVTGSEGHWYNFLFLLNSTMARGAMNDIKNNAAEIGANTVYLLLPIDFQTSVTLFGSAYDCQK